MEARLTLLPYTPTSGMLELGVDPETPGRLLITLAAELNTQRIRTYTDYSLTILSLDVKIEKAFGRITKRVHANS